MECWLSITQRARAQASFFFKYKRMRKLCPPFRLRRARPRHPDAYLLTVLASARPFQTNLPTIHWPTYPPTSWDYGTYCKREAIWYARPRALRIMTSGKFIRLHPKEIDHERFC